MRVVYSGTTHLNDEIAYPIRRSGYDVYLHLSVPSFSPFSAGDFHCNWSTTPRAMLTETIVEQQVVKRSGQAVYVSGPDVTI